MTCRMFNRLATTVQAYTSNILSFSNIITPWFWSSVGGTEEEQEKQHSPTMFFAIKCQYDRGTIR